MFHSLMIKHVSLANQRARFILSQKELAIPTRLQYFASDVRPFSLIIKRISAFEKVSEFTERKSTKERHNTIETTLLKERRAADVGIKKT